MKEETITRLKLLKRTHPLIYKRLKATINFLMWLEKKGWLVEGGELE